MSTKPFTEKENHKGIENRRIKEHIVYCLLVFIHAVFSPFKLHCALKWSCAHFFWMKNFRERERKFDDTSSGLQLSNFWQSTESCIDFEPALVRLGSQLVEDFNWKEPLFSLLTRPLIFELCECLRETFTRSTRAGLKSAGDTWLEKSPKINF